MDLNHKEFCNSEIFHVKIGDQCICNTCKMQLKQYHERFCTKEIETDQVKECSVVVESISLVQWNALQRPNIVLSKLKSPSLSTKRKSNSQDSKNTNKRKKKANTKYFNPDFINY